MSKFKIPTTPEATDKLLDELGELSTATLTLVPTPGWAVEFIASPRAGRQPDHKPIRSG